MEEKLPTLTIFLHHLNQQYQRILHLDFLRVYLFVNKRRDLYTKAHLNNLVFP